MADTKITSLQPPQVTTNPATDVLPIVNIADPLMATSGSTRKITVNQLLGAGGTATLASATITGDLTVDTSTLKVDSANNRVGIGTASPAAGYALDVRGILAAGNSAGTIIGGISFSSRPEIGAISNHNLGLIANNTTMHLITPAGVFDWYDGAGGTRMTLNSTGLGIGGVPSGVNRFAVFNGATQALTLDTSGNLLVGTTSNTNTARACFRYDTLTTQPVIASASIVAASTAWNHFVGQSGDGSTLTANNVFIRGNGDIVNANGVYGTISDLRLKENISDARNYLADLLKLRVVNYSLKEEASAVANKLGFLAQEVEQVFPKMVDTDKEDTKSIKISVLIPMLVKAIQELTARVQTLEAK